MGQVKIEVDNAIKSLSLTTEDISLLDNETGEKLYRELLNYYVISGDRRWWWEDFRHDSFSFNVDERTYELLDEIIPLTKEKVWFMVEDDEESFYPIYDANPQIIKDVLGQCFFFEYYIIDKNMNWLICENHHNRMIGVGEELCAINIKRIVN